MALEGAHFFLMRQHAFRKGLRRSGFQRLTRRFLELVSMTDRHKMCINWRFLDAILPFWRCCRMPSLLFASAEMLRSK